MSDPASPGSMVAVDEDSARGPERIALAIVVVLIGAFLGQVLRFPFLYDDHWTILGNPVIRSLGNLPALLGTRYAAEGVPDAGRPLMLATAMLDVKLWGFVPLGFHLQSLFWHACASVLLLLGLRHVTMSLPMALFGAAMFAVHPLNVEPVAVVNYREDLLVGTFLLAGLMALAASRRAQPGKPVFARKSLAAVLFILAAFAKESAYVAPLLVLLLDVLPPAGLSPLVQARGLPPGRSVRERLGDVCLAAGSVGLVFAWRAFAMGHAAVVSTTAETDGLGLFFRLVESAYAFVAGLTHVVNPNGLSPEYDPAALDGFGLFMGVLAMLVIAGLAGLVFALRRRAPLVSLGLGFALVAYLPTFGFVAITNNRADRYFYVPMMGIVLALVAGLAHASDWLSTKLRKRRPVMTVASMPVVWLLSAVVVAITGLAARRQSTVWANEEDMWMFAVSNAPNSPRSWQGWASTLLEKRRTLEAQNAALAGLQRFNEDPRLREILGLSYMNQGSFESGCNILRAAGDSGSPYERAQRASNLGYCLMRVGRLEEALPLFERARTLAPWFDRGWTNAAETLRRLGRDEDARRLLQKQDARNDGV